MIPNISLRKCVLNVFGVAIGSWIPVYVANKNFKLIGNAARNFMADIRDRVSNAIHGSYD